MIGIVDGITRDRGFLFIKTADGERFFGHISAFVELGLFGTIQVGAAVDFTPAAVQVEVGRKVAPRALAIRAIEPPRNAVGSCRPCELRRECYPDQATARKQLTPDDRRRAVMCHDTFCANPAGDRHWHLTRTISDRSRAKKRTRGK